MAEKKKFERGCRWKSLRHFQFTNSGRNLDGRVPENEKSTIIVCISATSVSDFFFSPLCQVLIRAWQAEGGGSLVLRAEFIAKVRSLTGSHIDGRSSADQAQHSYSLRRMHGVSR